MKAIVSIDCIVPIICSLFWTVKNGIAQSRGWLENNNDMFVIKVDLNIQVIINIENFHQFIYVNNLIELLAWSFYSTIFRIKAYVYLLLGYFFLIINLILVLLDATNLFSVRK